MELVSTLLLTEEEREQLNKVAEEATSPVFEDHVSALVQEAFNYGVKIGKAQCQAD